MSERLLRYSAPERLRQLPDTLSTDDLSSCGRKWLVRLTGGEARSFAGSLTREGRLGAHRRVTIGARLYLDGTQQTLVEEQAIVQGDPDDPDPAAA